MNAMMIGEVAHLSGVPSKTIRYYESVGLIRPASRRDNNYRTYDHQDVEFLRFIQRARSLGFSLQEVHQLIALYRDRKRSSRDVKRLALRHVDDLNHKIGELTKIRNVILELANKCRGDERPECPILDKLGSGAKSISDSEKPGKKLATAWTRRAGGMKSTPGAQV